MLQSIVLKIKDSHAANLSGAHGVIIPKNRAVGLTATVAKASAGALNYTPVVKVTNIAQTIEELKKRGVLQMVGGRAYVAQLTLEVPSTINAVEYGIHESDDIIHKFS